MKTVARRQITDYRPGVGILMLNSRGQVLVARRNDMQGDTWQMPQGGIHAGEAPRHAALRELKEEIGTNDAEILAESHRWLHYDLPRNLMGKAWEGRWRGQRQKWFVMRFTGADADINLATEKPEFVAWKWVSVGQLPQLVVSFKRQVYLDLLAEFPEISQQTLTDLMADPIVHMTMAADGVEEQQLYALLRRVAEGIRARTPEPLAPSATKSTGAGAVHSSKSASRKRP
jgi:putative (di)nucleoside polyphosphate hydrolase